MYINHKSIYRDSNHINNNNNNGVTMRNEQTDLFLASEELENLSPEYKREYYRGIIHDLLKKNEQGITAPQMKKLTKFSHSTVKNHLEHLVSTREAYKREYGDRSIVYFPNGRLCHHDRILRYKIGSNYYSFKIIENSMGEFLYLQEQAKDLDGAYTTKGGIIIEKENIPDLIRNLSKLFFEISKEEDVKKEFQKEMRGLFS